LVSGLEKHDLINLLIRFGIKKDSLVVPARDLSGGERMKVLLASIAANRANLLIMDEPTNNLDIPTVEAVESALENYSGAILLVSHDREFVEAVNPEQKISLS
jgi:ATPase subunit of ABC transporter with duplicated ATPase domains